MAQMEAVLELHSSSAVLETAARTFLSLCGEESSGGSVAGAAKDSLVQKWVDKLTTLLGYSLKALLNTLYKPLKHSDTFNP